MDLNKTTVEELLKKREEEFLKDKEALNRVLSMIGDKSIPVKKENETQSSNASDKISESSQESYPINELIQKALPLIKGEFTAKEVGEKMIQFAKEFDPQKRRSSISTALIILSKKGIIERTYAGGGKSPSRYIKKSSSV